VFAHVAGAAVALVVAVVVALQLKKLLQLRQRYPLLLALLAAAVLEALHHLGHMYQQRVALLASTVMAVLALVVITIQLAVLDKALLLVEVLDQFGATVAEAILASPEPQEVAL
jgi:hypothetical protein